MHPLRVGDSAGQRVRGEQVDALGSGRRGRDAATGARSSSSLTRQAYAEKICNGSSALTTYSPASTISEMRRSTHRLQSR